ncbi:MAG: NUDIX domain-containing protein [Myxococcales bacterium]|nr:NUDIX domain-containing protein [Myxococcales bacterium]
MPISDYLRGLREHVGRSLLLVPAVAAIIHDEHGRVLVLRTAEGAWTLPAGQIDPGESPREAVVREVREETGLEVLTTRLLDVYGGAGWRMTYANGDEVEGTVCVFACDVSGTLACDGVEIAEAHWIPGEQVTSLLSLPYPASLFA